MAITTLDGVVAGLAAGQIASFYKSSSSTEGAGFYHSLFRTAGQPSAAAAPATGAGDAPTKATAGAIPLTNAGGGNTLYLARASLSSGTIGHFMLYDRLVQTSGLSGTVTSAQDINSTALTRYTTGEGCQLWIEWQTATGSSSVNLTASYTNQANTSGQSTVIAFHPSPTAGQMQPVPLAAGDTGIRSVQSVTLSGTTGTAGNFGIVILKPLTDFPITAANTAMMLDAISVGLPVIQADACLALMMLCSASTQNPIAGQLNFIEG